MSAAPDHAAPPARAALPMFNPRDDAARLIAAMAAEPRPLALAELAPRAGIPVADARLALGRLKRLGLLDGSAADGWSLRRAAAVAAPAVEASTRIMEYLRLLPGTWASTLDIELATDTSNSQVLYVLRRLEHLGEVQRRPLTTRSLEWRAVSPA